MYRNIKPVTILLRWKNTLLLIYKVCTMELKNGNDAANHCSGFKFQFKFQFLFPFSRGVNVVPFLELMGLPDSIVGILKNSESGNALTAYALYKVSIVCK